MSCCSRHVRPNYLFNNLNTSKSLKRRLLSQFSFLKHDDNELSMLERHVIKSTDDPILPEAPSQYIENGYRKVKPSYAACRLHIFKANGKSWKQMRNDHNPQCDLDLQKECEMGRYFLNGKPIKSVKEMEMLPNDNDQLVYCFHRHEKPVSAQPIKIIHEDGDCLVVNKPCCLPVTMSGLYLSNNAMHILNHKRKDKILLVHRIDKMTSGVLILAKNKSFLTNCLHNDNWKKVEKVYIAEVAGKFPEREIECKARLRETGLGFMQVHSTGKECRSVFRLLRHKENSSLVECHLYTGRTHQIRVHLQYLGYPIFNDPLYNHTAWGEARFQLGGVCHVAVKDVARLRDAELIRLNKKNEGHDPFCRVCTQPFSESPQLLMHLHSHKYISPWWSFESNLPSWARL